MRRWQYGMASSAVAAVIGVAAVIATTEIEQQHGGAPPGRPALAGQSPGARSRARLAPVVRTSSRQPRPSQSAGPVLAVALNTPPAATQAPSAPTSRSPEPRPSQSGPPSSTPTPTPVRSTPAPPPPRPSPSATAPPKPTPTPSPSGPSPTPSPSCVLAVNALGITVCVPNRLGG